MIINKKIIERWEGKDKLYIFNPENCSLILLKNEGITFFKNFSGEQVDKDSKCIDIYQSLTKNNFIIEDTTNNNKRQIAEYKITKGFDRNISSMINPFYVLWEITGKCNLKCIYCLADANSKFKTKNDLTEDQLLTIASRFVKNKILRINISGGEPLLLGPKLFNVVRYLKKNNIFVSILSNGTSITNGIIDVLKKESLTIAISLDAANERVNSITRGSGTFDKAVKAIKLLKENNIRFVIICTITRHNFDFLPELFYFVKKELKHNFINLQNLCPNSNLTTYKELSLTSDQEENVHQMIQRLKRNFPEISFGESELQMFSHYYVDSMASLNDKNDNTLMRCRAGRNLVFVDYQGDCYPCTSLRMLKMGNLMENDLSELWQKSKAISFVRNIQSETNDRIKECKECKVNKICDAGCRGEAYYMHKNWYSLHPRCPKNLNIGTN